MAVDFSTVSRKRPRKKPTDPISLFETLTGQPDGAQDLWHTQWKVLEKWNKKRKENDLLISLNTGAGKTIIGLLIAQSLLNEGIENVLYLCCTNDLVDQTKNEANNMGIPCSTRKDGQFSDENFEAGTAFCITNYASLFNGLSVLRTKFPPKAIIFDDAHVAEKIIRESFTLRISRNKDEDLFSEISDLFRPHFHELRIPEKFEDSLDPMRHMTALVAPSGLYDCRRRLLKILQDFGVKSDLNMKYPYEWIKDNIDACAAIFSRGEFELSPPFLPSLAIDVFSRKARRVYLSATLQGSTDFIRAFGRNIKKENVISKTKDIAGNGERLIISEKRDKYDFRSEFVSELCKTYKTIIAVPSYRKAEDWQNVVLPSGEKFSKNLDKFRDEETGAFLLVGRVDGIDLPDDACRIMVIDGLPAGTSLLERYQWEFLEMNNSHRARITNRLAQLFGRIIRGRNDYGIFLIAGDDVRKWIKSPKNTVLFPPLLQKQINAGLDIEDKINSTEDVTDAIDQVINRSEVWCNFYQTDVKDFKLDKAVVSNHKEMEAALIEASLSEARYAAEMWKGNFGLARRELERTIGSTTRYDTSLGGWHAVWLGATYELEGDRGAACAEYERAISRLNNAISLPKHTSVDTNSVVKFNAFGSSLRYILCRADGSSIDNEIGRIRSELDLIGKGTPNQAEAGVRLLGELLGFRSSRPDNDVDTGPDVLWIDEKNLLQIGFELKTDKKCPAKYSKENVSQCLSHISWMSSTYPKCNIMGLIVVGPDGSVGVQANPNEQIFLCITERLVNLKDSLLALVEDLRIIVPTNREKKIAMESSNTKWSSENILASLDLVLLKDKIESR